MKNCGMFVVEPHHHDHHDHHGGTVAPSFPWCGRLLSPETWPFLLKGNFHGNHSFLEGLRVSGGILQLSGPDITGLDLKTWSWKLTKMRQQSSFFGFETDFWPSLVSNKTNPMDTTKSGQALQIYLMIPKPGPTFGWLRGRRSKPENPANPPSHPTTALNDHPGAGCRMP